MHVKKWARATGEFICDLCAFVTPPIFLIALYKLVFVSIGAGIIWILLGICTWGIEDVYGNMEITLNKWTSNESSEETET